MPHWRFVHHIARVISIVGHPAILVPGAILLLSGQSSAPTYIAHLALRLSIGIVLCVMVFSMVQVRRGNWSHIDASEQSERNQLNLILMLIFFGVGIGGVLFGQPKFFSFGLMIVGVMIAAKWLMQRWLKISLHTSFAMLATFAFWPSLPFIVGGIAITALIGWSRLILQRHTLMEVILGLLIGAITGMALVRLVGQ